MFIGKIVKSTSHIDYVCQVYGPREVEQEPAPADYAFGRFVRIVVRSERGDDHDTRMRAAQRKGTGSQTYAVGVIYNTILLNPGFGLLGPRLSNEEQTEVFSPDYFSERAVLISVIVLGMMEQRVALADQPGQPSITHGVALLSLELGSEVETMNDEEVCAFHYFSERGGVAQPFLHMGYLPHLLAQRNSLLPQVILQMIEHLERLFPEQTRQLSIAKRNFAWRLKVETTG